MSVKVIREPDDPLALRASIGGAGVAGEGNFYLSYRGDPLQVLDMLATVLRQSAAELVDDAEFPFPTDLLVMVVETELLEDFASEDQARHWPAEQRLVAEVRRKVVDQ